MFGLNNIVYNPTPAQMQQKLKIGDVYEYHETGVAFKLIDEYADGVIIQDTVTKVYRCIEKSYFFTYWHKQNK